MSVKNEPRLVPPLATPQSIFGTHRDLQSDHSGTAEQHPRKGVYEIRSDHGTNGTPNRDVSRRNQHKVSAWEGTLPKLGFGAIDISSLLDYEKRPKTPDDTILRPSGSPMRLPTPPDTPSDKKLSLAAGLDVAVLVSALPAANADGFSSATYSHSRTATASALHSADWGLQSTVQSSPPALNPSSAVQAPTEVRDLLRVDSETSSSSRDIVKKNDRNRGTPNNQEGSVFFEYPTTKQPLLLGQVIAQPLDSSCRRQSPRTLATPSLIRSVVEDGSDSHEQLREHHCDTTLADQCRFDNPQSRARGDDAVRGFGHRFQPATQAPGFSQYLEILTAAVHSKPQSCGSRDHSIDSKGTILPLKPSLVQAQAANSEARESVGDQICSEPTLQRILTSTFAPTPGSLDASTRVSWEIQGEKKTPPSIRFENIAMDQPRFAGMSAHLNNRHTVALPVSQCEEDEDDDDTGGCQVLSFVETPLRPVVSRQDPPQFCRNKPSPDEKITQDTFKARVHEVALFDAQLQSMPRVAKEEKLNMLARKLEAKELLTSEDDVHVFVDMSNIFIGFQDTVKIRQGLSSSARVAFSPMCFEHLAFVLERGREVTKRMLAGSVRHAQQMNNLPVHILDAKKYGFETKILHQVTKLEQPKLYPNSPYTSGEEGYSAVSCPRTKLGEQGVDEALHLSMQDSILDGHGNPGVMVLATGDAKPAEYSDGFAHYAIKALRYGWRVEIISWRKCLSGEWKKSPFKDKYASQFRIILLDDYLDEIHAGWAGGPSAVLARV